MSKSPFGKGKNYLNAISLKGMIDGRLGWKDLDPPLKYTIGTDTLDPQEQSYCLMAHRGDYVEVIASETIKKDPQEFERQVKALCEFYKINKPTDFKVKSIKNPSVNHLKFIKDKLKKYSKK